MASAVPIAAICRQWTSVRLRSLAQDTAWMMLERGVRIAVGFLVGIYCARLLGPNDYGIYAYALSLFTMFAFLGQAGLESVLVRVLVHAPDSKVATLQSALTLRLLGSLACLALALVAAVAMSTEKLPITPLVALIATGGVVQSFWVVEAWLHAQRFFRTSAGARSLGICLAALLRLYAVTSSNPLLALAAVSIAEAMITAGLLVFTSHGHGLDVRAVTRFPEPQALRSLWRESSRMLLATFAIAVYARIGMVMLGKLSGPIEVGLFSAAASLSEAFYAIPIALMAAATPRLANAYLRDTREFSAHMAKLLRTTSLAGLTIAISITILSDWTIQLTYGGAFARAAPILAIHIWSTWLVFISSASEPWYINHGLLKQYLAKTMLAGAANIALNLILIPIYGGVGAAAATLVSYAVSAVACNLLWADTRELLRLQLRAMLLMRGH